MIVLIACCLHDTWILDLHWRPTTMNQFDENIDQKVSQTYDQLYQEDAIERLGHTIKPSKSLGKVRLAAVIVHNR